jgi:imidazole glycerol-phosphate synthase subunit HisH
LELKIAVIKYNAGNIRSVINALGRLGVEAEITDDKEKLAAADKIIFPGVGEASSAMQSLREKELDRVIIHAKQPLLGICVGMQLLCDHSEENDTKCLGIIPAKVKKFEAGQTGLKVPQVGWNRIEKLRTALFKNIAEGSFIYNVHSYYAEINEFTIASCRYGVEYSAAVNKNNFYGVQFHTEKSAETGDKIIKNFLEL